MKERQLSCKITKAQEQLIDPVAKRLGIEKSNLVRQALDHWLIEGPEAHKIQDLVDKAGMY
jgi:hypothetical protein